MGLVKINLQEYYKGYSNTQRIFLVKEKVVWQDDRVTSTLMSYPIFKKFGSIVEESQI